MMKLISLALITKARKSLMENDNAPRLIGSQMSSVTASGTMVTRRQSLMPSGVI